MGYEIPRGHKAERARKTGEAKEETLVAAKKSALK